MEELCVDCDSKCTLSIAENNWFDIFAFFQVTEVVILRERHQNVHNSELVSDGNPTTSTNNESSWKTFTYPPLPVEEEIGILEQLKPPS